MNKLIYGGIFVVLFTGHLLLPGSLLVVLYGCLGISLAIWFAKQRFLWLTVLLSEIITGVYFWLFHWNHGQLNALAGNFTFSAFTLAATTIGINLITALLTTGTAYYLTRTIAGYPRRRNNAAGKRNVERKPLVLQH